MLGGFLICRGSRTELGISILRGSEGLQPTDFSLISLLVTGEFTNPHFGPPTLFREWAGIVLLVASISGMLVDWNWELAGALISLLSLVVFSAMIKLPRPDVLMALALPGVLYLFDWALRKKLQGGETL